MRDILLAGQIYINNNRDIEIYQNNILNNRKFGYEVLILDSSSSEFNFNHKDCDYYLYDRKNLLFNRPPYSFINFYYYKENIQLDIACENSGPHELNILYQNMKALKLAKSLGYKYVLRMECDIEFTDKDISMINSKIEGCISSNKKAVFMNLDNYIGFHVMFLEIDYYLDRVGDILNQKEWEKLLERHSLQDGGIETKLAPILYDEEYCMKFENLTSESTKGYRYKETRRYFKSDAIIDFFKDSKNEIYFACSNNSRDLFPENLIITQHTPNSILTNHIGDLGEIISWVYIDPNVSYVELNLDDVIHKITKEELSSTKNKIDFNRLF